MYKYNNDYVNIVSEVIEPVLCSKFVDVVTCWGFYSRWMFISIQNSTHYSSIQSETLRTHVCVYLPRSHTRNSHSCDLPTWIGRPLLLRRWDVSALLRDRAPTSRRQGNLTTCNIAPSLRLLVPSSLQRQSVDANHYNLGSKMPLSPVETFRRFWQAFTRSLASCFLLRAARSQPSGGAAAAARTVQQVTRLSFQCSP
jgi:hypothetical protein